MASGQRAAAFVAVFLLAALTLGVGVRSMPVGQAHVDPLDKLHAQDESLYTHCALQMATEGHWATPMLLGRYFLQKPPLSMWLAGASMKCFGVSLATLRLPAVLAGALSVALIFGWLVESTGARLALAGALLLVSNRLWQTYSRLAMTDVLLSTSIAAAVCFIGRDPRLERRASFWGFVVSVAAAVMTKSVAGAIPVLVLLLFWALMRGKERPSSGRVAVSIALAAALAAPWHLYQLATHTRWFWAEYVKTQLLGVGLQPAWQLSPEPGTVFYAKRLVLTDPVLALAILAIPSLWTAVRSRGARPLLLASWILVVLASMALFQAHNVTYLSMLLPPLSIVAAGYAPRPLRARPWLLVSLLGVIFVLKLWPAAQPWTLRPVDQNPSPSIAALRSYCERGRGNELILVAPDDDFYSATLPLPKVRYCWVAPLEAIARYSPHNVYLGVTVTAEQFLALDRWKPQFEESLRDWKLDSTEPLATAIVAASEAGVLQMIQTHARSDFFLPAGMRGSIEAAVPGTHQLVAATQERFFLLANQTQPVARRPQRSCW
jgi:hypothetical protein